MHLTHATQRARTLAPVSKAGGKGWLARWTRIAVATAMAAAAVGAAAGPALATPQGYKTPYQFRTIDNAKDLTFNQLLGINQDGVIAGYFGSGAQGHPNTGYILFASHDQADYLNENFPGSEQTQVTGLNDRGVTVGFWSSMDNANMVNDNHGFVDIRGHLRTADFPTGAPATPPVDQLLGVNDRDVAVGFYTDANGTNHGYEYNIPENSYSSVVAPTAPDASLTGAAINESGDVGGFYSNPASGNTDGFVLTHHGHFLDLAVPGAASTMALGITGRDEVVGGYQVGSGSSATMHGFTWTPQQGFQTVDEPNGIGTTTINGVNDEGQLVGFYTDANGNTDGFFASPDQHHHHDHKS